MSRYPCSGTYTPGGSGDSEGSGSSGGVSTSCANTINTSVTTYAVPVATLSSSRSGGVGLTNIQVASSMRLYFVGGYDENGNWNGSTLDVYNPTDGSVSTITLSQQIPAPSALLPVGWGAYPNFAGFYDLYNNGIVVYNVYKPITSAMLIDPTTGSAQFLSDIFSAWATPPSTFPQYAVISYDYAHNGLYLIPDDNSGTLTDHFFFDYTTNSWSTLTFNSSVSSDTIPLMFTTEARYGGSSVDGVGPRLYYNDVTKLFKFSTYVSAGATLPDQYGYYELFGGTDPYAVIDSDGVPYNQNLRGTGLHYAAAAIYDSTGTSTDSGDASILFGGYRNYGNKYVQEYHYLENLDTLAVSVGDTVITEICPIAEAVSLIATSYNEEVARGAIAPENVPPSVDTTSRTETIYVLYITGGYDPDTYTPNDSTLYAIVTPIKESTLSI